MPSREETTKLSDAFLAGARKLAEEGEPHAVPSPSGVADCLRAQWYNGKRLSRDNWPDNGESYISMESGRLSERTLSSILEVCDYEGLGLEGPVTLLLAHDERSLSDEEYRAIGCAGGEVDNVGVADPAGTRFLVEFKRKGVFDIMSLWRRGVLEAIPREYTQMQLYMKAMGLSRCLYIASNWDRGSLTNTARYAKDFKDRPNGVYVEWVTYSELSADLATKRALLVQKYLQDDTPAPRDYDPYDGKFPCTWCPWLNTCKETG